MEAPDYVHTNTQDKMIPLFLRVFFLYYELRSCLIFSFLLLLLCESKGSYLYSDSIYLEDQSSMDYRNSNPLTLIVLELYQTFLATLI